MGLALGNALGPSYGQGLFEVRTDLKNRIARVFFCLRDNKIVLLHGIIKKAQKTPPEALKIARQRMAKL